MIRAAVSLFVITTILKGALSKQGSCSKQDDLYKEWKCKPIFKQGSDCPNQYDCSNVFKKPKNKCFFQGDYYNVSEKISSYGLEGRCKIGCYCAGNRDATQLVCPNFVDCPNTFDSTCVDVYKKFDQCCPDKLCEPIQGVAKCKYGYRTYYEGERVDKDIGSTCICTEGRIQCEQNNCFEELDNFGKIQDKCAPVFNEMNCCPIEWLCYNKTKDAVVTKNDRVITVPLKDSCQYGNLFLNSGDLVSRRIDKNSGYVCNCVLPPLLTCWKYQLLIVIN